MIPIEQRRGIVKVDTAHVAGVPLETIPQGGNGRYSAMVLTKGTWRKLYFVNERKGWGEDEYFAFAERLLSERGISSP